MAEVKWSAPTSAINIAGTQLNSLGSSPIELTAQIDNRTLRHLYVVFRLTLGSFTPANNPFFLIRLLRDVGGVLPSRSATVFSGGAQFIIPLIASVGARVYETDRILLPGPWLFSVEVTNNANVTLAASGNQLTYEMFSEEV